MGQEPRSVATLVSKPLGVRRQHRQRHGVGASTRTNYTTVATIDVGTEPQAVVASPNGTLRLRRQRQRQHGAGDRHEHQHRRRDHPGRPQPARARHHQRRRRRRPGRDASTCRTSSPARGPGFVPPSSANLGGGDGAGAAFPAGAKGQPVVGEGIFDDSREAVVDVVSTATNTVVDQVVLAPMADTGFNFARGAFVNTTPGDAPRTIFADGAHRRHAGAADGRVPEPAAEHRALRRPRLRARTPRASPEPPLRFNLNVQSLVSVFDISDQQELADQTFNMNRGINFDLPAGLLDAQIRDNTDRLFPSVPVDIDCSEATGACWVVSQGSDFIVRMDFDGTGKPTINAPTAPGPFAHEPGRRASSPSIPPNATSSGRNPRGIVLDADGTHGYVVCPTTRDVVVADLVGNTVLQRVRSSELPTDPLEQSILRGKIDFFTSRPFWSDRGWGGCASCHPDGRTDNVTWSFEAGPRQTDLARRHLQQHRGPRRSAPAQLDPGARREPGLRAQHARHLRRPRLHRHQHRRQHGRHHARLRSRTSATTVPPAPTGRCSRTTSPTGSRSRSAAPSRRPAPAAIRPAGRDIFGAAAPGRRQLRRLPQRRQVDDEPRHLRPGRRQPGARARIPASSTSPDPLARVPERLQLGGRRRTRLRGARRRRAPPSACASCARSAPSRPPTRSRCATAPSAPSTPWRRR